MWLGVIICESQSVILIEVYIEDLLLSIQLCLPRLGKLTMIILFLSLQIIILLIICWSISQAIDQGFDSLAHFRKGMNVISTFINHRLPTYQVI